MRSISIFLVACSACLFAEDPKAEDTVARTVIVGLNRGGNKGPSDAAIAGLPKDSRPELLTWERAYTLALIRSRSAQKAAVARAEILDPKALAEKSKRQDVPDFARFRREFLGDRAAFRDPSRELLDLLSQAQGVDNAMRHIRACENLHRVLGF